MLRTIRSWFTTANSAKDRFVTNDKPTQANFLKLFQSVAFIAEKDDTAKLSEQGLAKTASDAEALAKYGPGHWTDGMTRLIQPYQLPDVIAKDSSILVDEVIWDATASAVVGSVVNGHDCRKMYRVRVAPWVIAGTVITPNPSFANEAWKVVGGGGTMANGEPMSSFNSNWEADQAYDTLAIRMTYDGKLAIKGGLQATGSIGAGQKILNLPAGYRPNNYAQLHAVKIQASDSSTIYVPLYCSGNGIYVYDQTTFAIGDILRVPETAISFN